MVCTAYSEAICINEHENEYSFILSISSYGALYSWLFRMQRDVKAVSTLWPLLSPHPSLPSLHTSLLHTSLLSPHPSLPSLHISLLHTSLPITLSLLYTPLSLSHSPFFTHLSPPHLSPLSLLFYLHFSLPCRHHGCAGLIRLILCSS